MDKLIKTLPAVLAAAGNSEEVAEAACVAAWKHAVGETLNARALPVELCNGVLVIAVEDNVWQKQLETMRGQILFRLNSILGSALVSGIEFLIDARRFRQTSTDKDLRRNKTVSESGDERLPPVIPIEMLSAAAAIEDPRLRRAFLGAAMSCVERVETTDY